MKAIPDVVMRAVKTFAQAFIAFLICELIPVFANIATIDFADWKTWLLPIVGGAIAAGLSAIQNNIINVKAKHAKIAEDETLDE